MKKNILLTLIALMCAMYTQAYDFKSGNLYYKFISDSTVEVCPKERTDIGIPNAYGGLISVSIPSSVIYGNKKYTVTWIGVGAFHNCPYLTSVTIPNSVTSIGAGAFNGCTGLTSVTIPNSVTNIGSWAFYGCTGLTSVTIPNSVTSISDGVFKDCTGLTSITIPCSVTSIGDNAFRGCTGLTSITIPNSVTEIGDGAFSDCSSLAFFTIPCSVTTIGNYVFSDCPKLSTVVWNAKKCNTGDVFGSFDSIETVVFGDEVEEIPRGLCYNMKKLTSVTIGNSVTSIGAMAFYGCTGLKQTNTGDIANWCAISFGGVGANPIGYSHNLYINGTEIIDLIIPDSVTSIGKDAFNGCSSLASVTIGNSVTSIGEDAFYGCTNLSSVIWNAKAYPDRSWNMDIRNQITSFVFGDKVERIPHMLCYGMKKLTSVTIPNSVTNIGEKAFCGCTGLNSVTIPNSVTSIGVDAFCGCTGLTSITIPESVTSMGDAAFYKCSNLTSVTISEGVTVVGENAFCRTGISTIFIPNSVTTIGKWAFLQCPNLTYAHIGNGIETIWQESFECPNIDSIRIEAKVPPEVKYTYWQNSILGDSLNIPVYVPCGSKDAYEKAEGWRTLTNIIEPASVYTIDVFSANTAIGTASITQSISACNDEAIITATPNNSSRYHFTQWSDGNTDNPRTIVVTQDTTFTAVFAPNRYTITVSAGEHSSVNGGGTYDYGTTATLTATANEHYHFTQWSDGNTDNPRTVAVVGDATYTAEFAIDRHSITVIYDTQQGVVTGAGMYDYGTQVTLTVIANKGYEFARWSNGVTDNPYMLTATADLTLEAQFVPATAVDNVSADGTTPQKIVRDGQVYILRNGKTYTTTGVEVK